MAANPVIAGAISAGAGIGGSLIAARQSRKNTEQTIAAAKEQAALEFKYNLAMWNKNNLYNSPDKQMERLKEAGLNPNLVYGNGSVAGNTSGTLPQYNAPRLDYSGNKPMIDLPMVLSMYQDFQMRQAQTDNIRAQEENTRARTATETFRAPLAEILARKAEHDESNLWPYQRGRAAAEAEAAAYKVPQEFEKLKLMRQDVVLKGLEEQYRRKGLTTQQIELEQKQANLLFSQYRNEWIKMGITTSDNVLLRVFARMMNESGLTPAHIGNLMNQE